MSQNVEYAGFWQRFIAAILDNIIFAVVIYGFFYIATDYFDNMSAQFDAELEYQEYVIGEIDKLIQQRGAALTPEEMEYYLNYYEQYAPQVEGNSPLYDLIAFIVPVIAGILFWRSKWQASPGKRMMGIYLISKKTGGRVTIVQAILRYVGYFISALILMIGYIMAGFTREKTALHDLIAGTRVVKGRAEDAQLATPEGFVDQQHVPPTSFDNSAEPSQETMPEQNDVNDVPPVAGQNVDEPSQPPQS